MGKDLPGTDRAGRRGACGRRKRKRKTDHCSKSSINWDKESQLLADKRLRLQKTDTVARFSK